MQQGSKLWTATTEAKPAAGWNYGRRLPPPSASPSTVTRPTWSIGIGPTGWEVLGHCVRSSTFRSLTSGGIDPNLVKTFLFDLLNGGATFCQGSGNSTRKCGLVGRNYFTLQIIRLPSCDRFPVWRYPMRKWIAPPPKKKNSFGWGVRFDLKRAHFFQQKIPSLNYTVSRGTKPTPSSTKAISHYFFVNVLSTVP